MGIRHPPTPLEAGQNLAAQFLLALKVQYFQSMRDEFQADFQREMNVLGQRLDHG